MIPYRIELGEIERTLQALDAVSSCVVVATPDRSGQKRLMAYVVPRKATADSTSAKALKEEYRSALAGRLPAHMVPSVFILMDALPLTVNGRVERQKLPIPTQDSEEEYVAPRNAEEQKICEVWQEVLGRERIGVTENFLSIGGDSILSIRVVSLLKSRGVQLSIRDLFQYQTIERLSTRDQLSDEQGPAPVKPFALLKPEEFAFLGRKSASIKSPEKISAVT